VCRRACFLVSLVFLLLVPVQASPCLKPSQKPAQLVADITKKGGDPAKYVYQEFPGPRGNETAWLVAYDHEPQRSLFIREAFFRPGPNKQFIKVLGVSGIADIYVPYARKTADGRWMKYWDIKSGYGPLMSISPGDAGGCGDLLEPVVAREVRDRGFLWRKEKIGRRGYELVIWGSQNAANYDYVILYHFLDDGTVQFRFGPTSRNYPEAERLVHLHTAIWRAGVELDDGQPGGGRNTVHVMKYVESSGEPDPKATVRMELFNGGKEGSVDWDPRSFTGIMVHSDKLRNANGKHTSVHVAAHFPGIVRHVGNDPKEAFSLGTYWVTVTKSAEFRAHQLATYADGESIIGVKSTVWVQTPILHVPRDEDGRCSVPMTEFGCPRTGLWEGVALVHLAGIDLMPKNLFDRTPFYK